MADSVVSGEIALANISHKPTRDALRQAAAMAAHGDPVWIVNRAGKRIGAIVSVERAERDDRERPAASGSERR
jgi:hypothetical protein